MTIRSRTTIAVACAAAALVGAGAHAGTAGDGGSGTYTSSGTSYYVILFNAGTTRWTYFHVVGPPGTVFVAGETAAETTARCVVLTATAPVWNMQPTHVATVAVR
jgi:hypothetical protein